MSVKDYLNINLYDATIALYNQFEEIVKRHQDKISDDVFNISMFKIEYHDNLNIDKLDIAPGIKIELYQALIIFYKSCANIRLCRAYYTIKDKKDIIKKEGICVYNYLEDIALDCDINNRKKTLEEVERTFRQCGSIPKYLKMMIIDDLKVDEYLDAIDKIYSKIDSLLPELLK